MKYEEIACLGRCLPHHSRTNLANACRVSSASWASAIFPSADAIDHGCMPAGFDAAKDLMELARLPMVEPRIERSLKKTRRKVEPSLRRRSSRHT